MAESIQITSLKDQTRERYLIYALSVITSRALPDVRDGLKPVQRRILYTMYNDLRLTFDGRPRKCAKIVGDVTGNYHPHGTSAAYDALVRLAQSWVLRVPLISSKKPSICVPIMTIPGKSLLSSRPSFPTSW